ncbi:MAG: hypothetical protein U0641_12605 [Anaerolineae bacterium]
MVSPSPGHSSSLKGVAFSPDGKTLASASADETIRLWDVSNPQQAVPLGSPLKGHSGVVENVAFSPDGKTLASASNDSTIILWDVSDPEQSHPIGQPLTGLALGPSDQTLTSAGGDRTLNWENPFDLAQQALTQAGPISKRIGSPIQISLPRNSSVQDDGRRRPP